MKEETIYDIVSELRCESALPTSKDDFNESLRGLASRIEAAAERMRDAYCDLCKEKDAAYDRLLLERDKAIKARAPGNAAAMRDALEKISNMADLYPRIPRSAFANTARAAISAPARNCDRFATEDEAREAYWAYREPLEFNNKPFVAITEWLFAAAEGGAE